MGGERKEIRLVAFADKREKEMGKLNMAARSSEELSAYTFWLNICIDF